jgi:uncharacterized membrane protein YjjP (DUF1212 family)
MSQEERFNPDVAELLEFLVQLGLALTVSGGATSLVRRRLRTVAAAYGQPLRSTELPTATLIEMEGASSAQLAFEGTVGGSYRFDQTAAVYVILDRAEQTQIAPTAGLARLREIRKPAAPPRCAAAHPRPRDPGAR